MTKESPILFTGSMVTAIRQGRKTQTRRVVKPQPIFKCKSIDGDNCWVWGDKPGYFGGEAKLAERLASASPYGQSGDHLWVRETFLPRLQNTAAIYRADLDPVEAAGVAGMYGGWKPSIHMPRWASRLSLEIKSIRVERLQSITEADVAAEGLYQDSRGHWCVTDNFPASTNPRYAFELFWNLRNADRGFAWDTNPWLWVIEFKPSFPSCARAAAPSVKS